MICEKCKGKMNWSIEGATQGWRCPMWVEYNNNIH